MLALRIPASIARIVTTTGTTAGRGSRVRLQPDHSDAGAPGVASTSGAHLQDLFQPFRRPRQNRARSFLDDRSLNQIGMRDHHTTALIIDPVALADPQLLVD